MASPQMIHPFEPGANLTPQEQTDMMVDMFERLHCNQNTDVAAFQQAIANNQDQRQLIISALQLFLKTSESFLEEIETLDLGKLDPDSRERLQNLLPPLNLIGHPIFQAAQAWSHCLLMQTATSAYIFRQLAKDVIRCDPKSEDHLAENAQVVGMLLDCIEEYGKILCQTLQIQPNNQPLYNAEATKLDDAQEMLWWDAGMADFLEKFGETGRRAATQIRTQSKQNTRLFLENGQRHALLWDLWAKQGPCHEQIGERFRENHSILWAFVVTIWHDVARPKWDSLTQVGRPALTCINHGEDDYSVYPKPLHTISWAVGQLTHENKSLTSDMIQQIQNGENDLHTNTPELVSFACRSLGVEPVNTIQRPHQLKLHLGFSEESRSTNETLANAICDAQFLLSPHDAKLLLLLCVLCPKDMREMKVDQLVKLLNPSKNRIRRRDRDNLIESAYRLKTLHLVAPGENGWSAQILDISHQNNNTAIRWGFGQNYLWHFKKNQNSSRLTKSLNGNIFLNLSAAMRFKNNQAGELRHYLYACAMWNDAYAPGKVFEPNNVRRITLEDWAKLTNSLSPAAIDYLNHHSHNKRAKGKRLSKNMARTRQWLEKLAEEFKLVKIEGTLQQKQGFRIMPTAKHIEAKKRWTKEPTQRGLSL